MMASQLVVCHPTDGVDEVLMVKILEPILIGIVGVGSVIEIMSQRVFDSILIASILGHG